MSSFRVPSGLKKEFCNDCFLDVVFYVGVKKYAQNWFYIEYSTYTHVLCVSVYIICLTISLFSSTDQTFVLNIWQGTKIWHVKDIFQDMQNFQDIEGLVWRWIEVRVEILNMEIFLDMEIIPDMQVKHHTLYRTTIGGRKNTSPSI